MPNPNVPFVHQYKKLESSINQPKICKHDIMNTTGMAVVVPGTMMFTSTSTSRFPEEEQHR
jgi:hypothetical protein